VQVGGVGEKGLAAKGLGNVSVQARPTAVRCRCLACRGVCSAAACGS
jgi:hypothetical protein